MRRPTDEEWREEQLQRAERTTGMTREQAMEPSPLLADLKFVEASPGTHRTVVRTPLPDITWRDA